MLLESYKRILLKSRKLSAKLITYASFMLSANNHIISLADRSKMQGKGKGHKPTRQQLMARKRQLKILYLQESDLGKHPDKIAKKARLFYTLALLQHNLFKKHDPILFGGAALALHHYKSKSSEYHREIDDLDFFVTDIHSYNEFATKRKIDFENKTDKRLHFFQKIDQNFYIKITICFVPEWAHRTYHRLYGIRVMDLKELKAFKMVGPSFDPQICEHYRRGNSPTKYFVRKEKKQKDINDIFLINSLMNASDKTK